MPDRMREHARNNRNNPTEPEVRLWRTLSHSKLSGLNFRRQYRTGGRIIDFFCPALNLGIEIDGHTDDPEIDRVSDARLEAAGVHVIRFTNTDVMTNIDGVAASILSFARSRPMHWRIGPHPNPSLEGEGL